MLATAGGFVLAAGVGRGATGHHAALYIGGSVVIALVFLVAVMLRNRRR
jgi:hypothetical protein